MCGIAGLIHRGKSSNVGEELQHRQKYTQIKIKEIKVGN